MNVINDALVSKQYFVNMHSLYRHRRRVFPEMLITNLRRLRLFLLISLKYSD
jgi:hypothetical protein